MHLRVSPPEDLAGMKHAILTISFYLFNPKQLVPI